jgi:dolichyl-phosphate beta-glucosyltransferase
MVDVNSEAAIPELSIVIPAYDEAQRLPRFLESVTAVVAASGRDIEIIVVDDGSSDGTAEGARAPRAPCPRQRVVGGGRTAGPGAAGPAGLARARGARRL